MTSPRPQAGYIAAKTDPFKPINTGVELTPSFRDGPKDRTRKLEIPGSLRAPE